MTPARLKRVLLSLPDPTLRVVWLTSEITRLPSADAAAVLSAVIEEAEAQEPHAREALLTIAIFCVDPNNAVRVGTLRDRAVDGGLFGLERLLRRGPATSVRVPMDEPRVPDYGTGRELTLGERKSLARRPDRRAFDKLLSDPHPMVIRQLLENPKMIEEDAIRLAAIRPARVDVIRELVRAHRWMGRPRVRQAIILNPGTPSEIAIPFVCLCNREELHDVLQSTDTSLVLRATAQELLARRPPVPESTRTIH
jgi:hypothetical protein